MRQLEPTINCLSVEELRELVFGGSRAPIALEEEQLDKYRKLSSVLQKFPIRNRKVCLLVPPAFNPEAADYRRAYNRRYSIYPPYGILTLSSAIRHFMPSWSVQILDLYLETLKRTVLRQEHDFETLLELIPEDCDLYGVTIMFESAETEAIRCIEYLSNNGKLVISGGAQSTADFENLLKHDYCNIVIKKEGQTQLIRLLSLWERVNNDQSEIEGHFQEIYNLAFRYSHDVISFEDKLEKTVSLDIRKEYGLINLDEYNEYGLPHIYARTGAPSRKWATLLTNRGCRGHCTFCQVADLMDGVRSRSVSDVIDEILFLYHEKNVRHIEVLDDDFLAYRDHALQLFHRWAELNLDLTFSTGNAVLAISIDEEMAKAMVDAGCVVTGFGVETGNEERLRTLRRPASLKKVREACCIFKKNHPHIWVFANFIIGFPNETYGELFDTFNYAKSLEIDYCQCAVLHPIPGTPVYEQICSLRDERAIDRLGTDKMTMYSPGEWVVARGLTFDDIYKEIYDFRDIDPEKIPGTVEIQQFQIYFNVFVNLLGSIHLKPGGMPERAKSLTDNILKAYPMDAISWGVNARAARLLGDEEGYEIAVKNYRKAVKESRFWSMFFEVYDVAKLMGIPV